MAENKQVITKSKFDAVLFDLDGVLSPQTVAANLGRVRVPVDALLRFPIGGARWGAKPIRLDPPDHFCNEPARLGV